ncbi:MAG: hypothetical protein Ct9H90mP16_04750 [Candidatus Poseidoniales archaeon]|nr:MAG: hypothetical protein Ct9H90mP16_04750 [Candidatus Poseidoniales archaeon]
MMLATTVFFLVERQNVAAKWKTSMTVAALVTGIAWYHYTYMRQHWVDNGSSPIVYRYIDWLLTVPLQIAEFYLILAAIGVASVVMFRNLMVASIVMLVAGFFGRRVHGISSEVQAQKFGGLLEWPAGFTSSTRFSRDQSTMLHRRPVKVSSSHSTQCAGLSWLDGHLSDWIHDGQRHDPPGLTWMT